MGNSESREEAAGPVVTRHSMPSTASAGPVAGGANRAPSASVGVDNRRLESRELEGGGIERGQAATEEATGQLSYWYLLKHGYNELVHLIIRPPRAEYEDEDLGPAVFSFGDREFVRQDFVVQNDRGQRLQCSHWKPVDADDDPEPRPCVVYLHGNSSCRLEALGVLRTCLASGLTVVALDCAGCGKSDGEYISLGYYERDDLQSVIDHLRATKRVGAIGLWGRSMGAATALLHADRDHSIAGIVVDSAFTNLDQLVQEVVEHGRQEGLSIPKFLVKLIMKCIRSSVHKRAHFDLKKLSPIDHAAASFVPALFVAAEDDSFIAPHHSDQLYARYGGDKNIVKVDGDHNTARPQFLLDSAGIFLQAALRVDPRLCPDTSAMRGGNRPPWEHRHHHHQRSSSDTSAAASSPTSVGRMTMDLDARFSGKDAMLVPMEPWSCPSCTYVNGPLRMQVCSCFFNLDRTAMCVS